jgi:hypothetical protein
MGRMRLGRTIWISWTTCSMTLALGWGAVVEVLVDVLGEGVEFVI